MEVRSIRKLETRHVNLKPTERSERREALSSRAGSLIFVLTDTDILYPTYILDPSFHYKTPQCSVQTAIIMTVASVSLRCSCFIIIVFSHDMTFGQTISCTKRENWVSDVFVSTCIG